MTIEKTKNGTYRLRLYLTKEEQKLLNVSCNRYEKTFKTRKEARTAHTLLTEKIIKLKSIEHLEPWHLRGETQFKDFYQEIWLDAYIAGQTTSTPTPPRKVTIDNTLALFKHHILPLFGDYTLSYLNQNKPFVRKELTKKASEYANFKAIRSYVNSIFDWAVEMDYLDSNRLKTTISKIKASKKIQLQQSKNNTDLYLSEKELQKWFDAANDDLNNGSLSLKNYTLFYLTFILSDRKSESYALQWKHIDFETQKIYVMQSLDKYGNPKPTKGNKTTVFNVPDELIQLLTKWKKIQAEKLLKLGIRCNTEQFVFTYTDTKGNINKPLHIDYLNYVMKAIRKRHPELVHATPHKLRHTGATLAKQHGISMIEISEALTHSNVEITRTYVNTPDVIKNPMGAVIFNKVINTATHR